MMLVCNEEKGGVGEGLHIFIQFVGGGGRRRVMIKCMNIEH